MSETWKEKVDAAYDMVHALCQPRGSEGSREWIMSIPARPEYDPDLVITSGLRAAAKEIHKLAAEVDARDEVIAKLLAMWGPEEILDHWPDSIKRKVRRMNEDRAEEYARACEIAERTE